jgi:ABC-type polysaccharide/polyol phosphate export permease
VFRPLLFAVPSETSTGTVRSLPVPPSRTLLARRDLVDGGAKSWMWMTLALQDIKLPYRGWVFGPFWLTISAIAMVSAMGMIYFTLFQMEVTPTCLI